MKKWLVLGVSLILIFFVYQFLRYTYLEKSFDKVELSMTVEQLDDLISATFQTDNCPLGEIEGISKKELLRCNKVRIYRLGVVKFGHVYLDKKDKVLFKTIVFSP
ncbi:MAG: hypothetical protein E6Q26_00200 [Acinetobacter sp.]|nr:MAG: hypothetical protein E6Q26_00200 [Acinetobacter sp.]